MVPKYLYGSFQGLELVNIILCKLFEKEFQYFNKKINFIFRLVDLYQPYLFFYGM